MDLTRNLHHTVRSILRSPAYAVTCIAVIGLGVGANAAIFSMVHSVILTPLPYPDSDRLMFVWEKLPNMPDPPGGRLQVARKNYVEWKQQNRSFAGTGWNWGRPTYSVCRATAGSTHAACRIRVNHDADISRALAAMRAGGLRHHHQIRRVGIVPPGKRDGFGDLEFHCVDTDDRTSPTHR